MLVKPASVGLRIAPVTTIGSGRPDPAQLPADIPDFTGRPAATARIRELLSTQADDGAVRVIVISGPAGIGNPTPPN